MVVLLEEREQAVKGTEVRAGSSTGQAAARDVSKATERLASVGAGISEHDVAPDA